MSTVRTRLGDAEVEVPAVAFLVFEDDRAVNVFEIAAMVQKSGPVDLSTMETTQATTSITLKSGQVIDVPQSLSYVLGRVQVVAQQIAGL